MSTPTSIAIIEETEEQLSAKREAVDSFITAVQQTCSIKSCPAVAALDDAKRSQLSEILGDHGLEAMVLASLQGNVLWTDDFAVAAVARSEFGVRRVWTQVAIQHQVDAGGLDVARFIDCSAHLVGWGYEFTGINMPIIIRAGKLADWDPDRWPLANAMAQLASPSVDQRVSAQLSGSLIVYLFQSTLLAEQVQSVVIRLLDILADRPHGIDIVVVVSGS